MDSDDTTHLLNDYKRQKKIGTQRRIFRKIWLLNSMSCALSTGSGLTLKFFQSCVYNTQFGMP